MKGNGGRHASLTALHGAKALSNRKDIGTDGPWYAEGLRFGCRRCGNCCTGPPGYVWVSPEEREDVAAFLGLSVKEFDERYCRAALGRISLREMPNGDCIFLEPEGCRIYPVRPRQCRTFPFWPDNLGDAGAWEALKTGCPGVGRGTLYSRRQIERILAGKVPT